MAGTRLRRSLLLLVPLVVITSAPDRAGAVDDARVVVQGSVVDQRPSEPMLQISTGERDNEDGSGAFAAGQAVGATMVLGGLVGAAVWAIQKARGTRTTTWSPTVAVLPPPPTGPAVTAPPAAPVVSSNLTITTTRTIAASADALYRAIAEPMERSGWLPDDDLRVVQVTPPRWVRFSWGPDKGRVTMSVARKPDGRSLISIRHAHLHNAAEADLAKAHWRSCLTELPRRRAGQELIHIDLTGRQIFCEAADAAASGGRMAAQIW